MGAQYYTIIITITITDECISIGCTSTLTSTKMYNIFYELIQNKQNLSKNLAEMEKKVALHCEAIAFPIIVFPVPGGLKQPNSNITNTSI